MPTVLRQNGFEFIIYLNDHEPMHVHVFYQGNEAIINFAVDLEVRQNYGLNRSQLRQALVIVIEHRELLQTKWREINER
jgi:hypothetical protein